jgi:hypothetical protein
MNDTETLSSEILLEHPEGCTVRIALPADMGTVGETLKALGAMPDLPGDPQVKLTDAQKRALGVVATGDCWQRRGGGVNRVRIDVLYRLMNKDLVRWEKPPHAGTPFTGQAFLTDRGREVLRDA